MADRADLRSLLGEGALAALGAVALTADRLEELAGEIAERGGLSVEEARTLLREQTDRWRAEAVRFGDRAGERVTSWARELGLVTRDDLDDLELRLAQLEHRLSLLEPPIEAPSEGNAG